MKHQKTLISVKKAIGHLQKVLAMIESQQYCIDVMQQMNAAIGHLRSGQSVMLENHFNSCAIKALSSEDALEREKCVAELLRIFNQK